MSKTSDTYGTYYKYNKKNEKDSIVFIHGIGLTHQIWNDQNFVKYPLLNH